MTGSKGSGRPVNAPRGRAKRCSFTRCYNQADLPVNHSMPVSATPPSALPPGLTFVMELRVTVGQPVEVGELPHGRRRVVPIIGGTFEGPDLCGGVLDGGADWQLIRNDGVAELDARYLLRTDAGQMVYIRNAGLRHAPAPVMAKLLAGQEVDPSLVYFRTAPTFETAAADLQWLTRSLFVATGERHPAEVVIRVWKVE